MNIFLLCLAFYPILLKNATDRQIKKKTRIKL